MFEFLQEKNNATNKKIREWMREWYQVLFRIKNQFNDFLLMTRQKTIQ